MTQPTTKRPKRVLVSVYIDDEYMPLLEQAVQSQSTTKASYLRQIIHAHFDNQPKPTKGKKK